ncbi:transglycosylase domain-containing protein [Amycolatopsis aidingensis]|uniref:transglycosylase domain-containing protein n=1 Tax=Amycolatopsis aidingensis TaxID=2842453 RepID=UPI001C0E69B3|nr:transglycosylase domain-containing protein [Amycolatopsis aidingensis]
MVGRRIGPEDREPELLTHDHHGAGPDDPDYGYGPEDWPDDDEQQLYEHGLDEEDEEPRGKNGKPPLTPRQRKKRRWRRIRRTLYALFGLFVVLPALAFTITYFLVDVPTPEEVAADQNKVVTYLFDDGSEMGKDVPPGGNRVLLNYSEIPEITRKAVYATEDATFETNSGFDVTGIMRAVYNQVTGGVGGGSTISQQYIKVATQNDEYSYTRKFLELVKSFKMNQQQEKSEIITAYLNTIYFGRGAYGLQTAAQAYFGKDAKDLNASESALLAGLIQQPGRSENPEVATERWNVALDRMVENKWLGKAERDSMQFPEMIPLEQSRPNTMNQGPAAFIKQRVKAELEAKGYPEEKLQAGGYRIHTTIDPEAQKLAVQAVNKVMKGQPENLRKALVAVNPKSGGVMAYYGGPNEPGVDQVDWANTQRNPGSSYKPFDLVALLLRGKGLGETYDGRSGRTFEGREQVVNNAGPNSSCSAQCTVAEAMKRSANTVFYQMVMEDTGVQAVVDAALAAGIPESHGDKKTMDEPTGNISIGGGRVEVTPEDMASAYATFAAEGIHHESHFVSKLEKSDGSLVFEVDKKGEPAFDSDDSKRNAQIAGNVTKSLEPVLPFSDLDCAGNRDCAGKTGTHQSTANEGENSQAWMVGYTPSISAAAWVGTGRDEAIKDKRGRRIYGSGLPGEIWKEFMDSYLKGKPKEEFPKVDLIGKEVRDYTPQTRDRNPTTEREPETSEPETSDPTKTSSPPTSITIPTPPTNTKPGNSTGPPDGDDEGIGLLPGRGGRGDE